MDKYKKHRIVILLLTACVFYFLGGTPIPLTTCFNFACTVNYFNANENAQCKKVFYYFNTLEECDGKYVSISDGFYRVGRRTELHSDSKHRIGSMHQLRRDSEILFGNAYHDDRSFETCKNMEEVAAHEEKCISIYQIN